MKGDDQMATLETLIAVVGQPVTSDAVQSLIAEDCITESINFDLGVGEPQRTSLAHRSGGYQLSHQRGRIDLAIVYAQAIRGFQAFASPLPEGFPLEATRAEVRRQLGIPSRSGIGDDGPWDGYVIGKTWVFLFYDTVDERVMWTMIEPAVAPPDA
jgi:hypothetical protein